MRGYLCCTPSHGNGALRCDRGRRRVSSRESSALPACAGASRRTPFEQPTITGPIRGAAPGPLNGRVVHADAPSHAPFRDRSQAQQAGVLPRLPRNPRRHPGAVGPSALKWPPRPPCMPRAARIGGYLNEKLVAQRLPLSCDLSALAQAARSQWTSWCLASTSLTMAT